ncbi:CYTH and CHAD domain-containing protein [Streptomyces sp. NPDC048717]|uniref:CYTH and CHAD domain-containing protein n=1 Tax=Streptomyces sp. NPDC048717 TaxID=3154928 RepID=UPI0034411415
MAQKRAAAERTGKQPKGERRPGERNSGATTHREIERKYEVMGEVRLPDLTRAHGVATAHARGVTELDAVYYDTADLRLAADSLTLRRRTGGGDAGWHLKIPVAPGVRDEIRAPLSDTLPRSLAGLLRSRVRTTPVQPVVRLRSRRDVTHLHAADGTLLAEVSVDTVHAERLTGCPGSADWTEIEVELADDVDPEILEAVEKRLVKAGIQPSAAPSKLARALAATGTPVPERPTTEGTGPDADTDTGTAGSVVLAYVREQVDALIRLDPAVRRDQPDAIHRMRVACRRLRSALRTYGNVLDREVTDPLAAELRRLAGELGAARDLEVLDDRIGTALAAIPRELAAGPVHRRLKSWAKSGGAGTRRRAQAALDSPRHLALLTRIDALLADPPLLPAAHRAAGPVLRKAVLRDHRRLARRVERALALDPGTERDHALHDARKAAKRVRYAAEAAAPALGKPARRLVTRMKRLQDCLGDHQDSVVARAALRELADAAHTAGETAFTWGVLYGREEAVAADRERELPRVWARSFAPRFRAARSR